MASWRLVMIPAVAVLAHHLALVLGLFGLGSSPVVLTAVSGLRRAIGKEAATAWRCTWRSA
jgi:hypothetical protein